MALLSAPVSPSWLCTSQDHSWTINTSSLIQKAHQRLFFLKKTEKDDLSTAILANFTSLATVSQSGKPPCCWPQGTAGAGENRPRTSLPPMEDGPSGAMTPLVHSFHWLFQLLPCSGSLNTRTGSLRKSFCPTAVSLLNYVPAELPSSSHCTSTFLALSIRITCT